MLNNTSEQLKKLQGIANAFRQSILLLTANRLRLFDFLTDKTLSAAQIAAQMDWDVRAAELFLNALTAMGFLRKQAGQFSNSEISQNLLVAASPNYQGDILNHSRFLWDRWSRVEEVLISGRSLRDPNKRRTEEELRAFICGMANLARPTAANLWGRVDLSPYRRLLDLGGGPGTYALSACQRFPDLKTTVYDLPEVEPLFLEERQRFDLEQRAAFHAGDFLKDPLPEGCDVALLFSIIHSYGEDANRALLRKLYNALVPGGLLLIKEFYITDDGTAPLTSALFAVNMLLGTQAGNCYSIAAVRRWLEAAGFAYRECLDLGELASVIIAQK